MVKLGCRGLKNRNKIAIDLALSLQETNLQTFCQERYDPKKSGRLTWYKRQNDVIESKIRSRVGHRAKPSLYYTH